MLIADPVSYVLCVSGLVAVAGVFNRLWRRARPLTEWRRANRSAFSLLDDLDSALSDGSLQVEYQPKLHLARDVVDSAEALIRWTHPKLGPIDPKTLIAATEAAARIEELTVWVARRVAADLAEMARRGIFLRIYINVSARLVTQQEFIQNFIRETRAFASHLGVEITETALISDHDVAVANLHRLADAGIAISLDDYGTGLSSLAYLKRLPATELKIDRLFIAGLTASQKDPLIVRSTIDLAHALDMTVVAEGVDTPAALSLLRAMGCDYVQGFLISPALKLPDLITFATPSSTGRAVGTGSVPFDTRGEFWTPRNSLGEQGSPRLRVVR